MKIWTSPQTTQSKYYALRTAGCLAGLFILAALLLAGSVIWSIKKSAYREQILLLGCLLITALIIWISFRIGRKAWQNATFFWLDSRDRLFVLDIRQMIPVHRGIWGYFHMLGEIQRNIEILKRQLEENYAPWDEAGEILNVEKIQEFTSYYVFYCHVELGNGTEKTQRCCLGKDWPGARELLYILERKYSPVKQERNIR